MTTHHGPPRSTTVHHVCGGGLAGAIGCVVRPQSGDPLVTPPSLASLLSTTYLLPHTPSLFLPHTYDMHRRYELCHELVHRPAVATLTPRAWPRITHRFTH